MFAHFRYSHSVMKDEPTADAQTPPPPTRFPCLLCAVHTNPLTVNSIRSSSRLLTHNVVISTASAPRVS
jgi:hypothetical protein